MPHPSVASGWTVDMLDALADDGQKYELIDGELFVTPAPANVHQLVLGALHRRVYDYVRSSDFARALFSPADVRQDDRTRNRVQPDVFVVRLVEGRHPPYPYDISALLLAVEVVSPSNPLLDYHVKRELYLSKGVPAYWIVDTDARIVTRWYSLTEPGEVISDRVTWHLAGMPAPLVIDLAEMFEDALA